VLTGESVTAVNDVGAARAGQVLAVLSGAQIRQTTVALVTDHKALGLGTATNVPQLAWRPSRVESAGQGFLANQVTVYLTRRVLLHQQHTAGSASQPVQQEPAPA
jgi:hypothetical protein